MFKKTCFRCTKNSFSSTTSGEWVCPSCQADLSNVKAVDSEEPTARITSYHNNRINERYLGFNQTDYEYNELI